MPRLIELSRSLAPDEDYWLSHCEGFRVEAEGRRLGVVAEVRFRSGLDRPDELVVCGGTFGNRFLVLATGGVAAVVPREQRVVLQAVPAQPARRTTFRRWQRAGNAWLRAILPTIQARRSPA